MNAVRQFYSSLIPVFLHLSQLRQGRRGVSELLLDEMRPPAGQEPKRARAVIAEEGGEKNNAADAAAAAKERRSNDCPFVLLSHAFFLSAHSAGR